MSGKKPAFNIQAKSKQSGNKINLLAFWENENGMFGGSMSEEVAKIVLKDGKTITPEGCYFNLYDNREEKLPEPKDYAGKQTSNDAYEGEGSGNIPF